MVFEVERNPKPLKYHRRRLNLLI